VNSKLLFSFLNINNGNELWKSDGTAAGTIIVKDIYSGNHSSIPGGITYLKNSIALFSANDGMQGNELWITNGETSGTTLVKNINNTTTSNFGPDLHGSAFFNNKLFFSGYTPEYGSNVYISDGTASGTQLLKGH
jgi:ELWxxDGT repeat protein